MILEDYDFEDIEKWFVYSGIKSGISFKVDGLSNSSFDSFIVFDI